MRAASFFLAATATFASTLPASAADVFGNWLSAKGEAIIEIVPCGASACGTFVWLAEPLTPEGQPKVDINNPDPALQTRTICGMQLIGDFVKGSDGRWTDGKIYDPQKGKMYNSKMHVKEDGTLYLRGHLDGLLSMIGRSEIWTPVPDNRGGC